MTEWRDRWLARAGDNPRPWLVLLAHQAEQNPVLARRMALLDILCAEAYLTREELIAKVQERLGEDCFGQDAVQALWEDMRALRAAGMDIRYSRSKGRLGYYLRTVAVSEEDKRKIRAVFDEIDYRQMAILRSLPPARRTAMVFELCEALRQSIAASVRSRELDIGDEELARRVRERVMLAHEH